MNSLYQIQEILTKRGIKLSVAESCTGGLISSKLTDIHGASKFIEINFVTYSEYAKIRFLGVPKSTIDNFGIVSKETAEAMARGLLKYSGVSISTTGYAGISEDKNNPTGTVYYAFGYKNMVVSSKYVSNIKERPKIKEDMANHILDDFLKFILMRFV